MNQLNLGNAKENRLFVYDDDKRYFNSAKEIHPEDENSSFSYIIKAITDNSVVLDIGCSYGYLGEWLTENKNCQVYGIDINNDYLEFVKESGYYKDLYNFDIDYPKNTKNEFERFEKLKEIFDFIICADVLEHLKNPTDALDLISSKLKFGGQVLVSIPNIAHIDIILNLLEGNFNYSEFGILDNTHLRFFTKKSFVEWIKNANDLYKYRDFKFDIKHIGTTHYLSEYQKNFINLYPNLYKKILNSNPDLEILQNIFILIKINASVVPYNLNEFLDRLQNKKSFFDISLIKLNDIFLKYTNLVTYKKNRVIILYRKLIDAILPHNSIRRKVIKFIVKDSIALIRKSISYIKIHGLKDFFRKVVEKIKSINYFIPKQCLILFNDEINEHTEVIVFKEIKNPKVSIIIPVHNKFKYTYNCLKSIYHHTSLDLIEVIIADDSSYDETVNINQYIKNVKVVRNENSLGFIKNCNKASKFAKGQYLLFLNNDTQVQPEWLVYFFNIIEKDNKVGLIGPKFIYPDGKLQEAGGIIWNDASGWNYGKFDDPEKPEYNYLKEVDYISGACILIKKELWNEIGGFDQRYSPAYFEDTDLAFEVRERGYKVLYQPKSRVVHFEGVSHGTNTSSGIKKYQNINRTKFLEKWKKVLEKEQFINGQNVFLARDHSRNKPHILVIDHYVPHFDKDAGSKTIFTWLNIFIDLGIQVTFIGDNFYRHEPYTSFLQQLGIEVIYGSAYADNWYDYLKKNLKYFKFVLLSRTNTAEKYLDSICFIKGKYDIKSLMTLYYPHDLSFLRFFREYEFTKNKYILHEAKNIKKKEYELFTKFDVVLLPSLVEKEIVKREFPHKEILVIPPFSYSANFPLSKNDSFQERKGLLFIGGFSHRPNYYGIKWFIEQEIWKNIKQKIKDIEFYIAGSNIPKDIEILGLYDKQIKILGYLSEEKLNELYNEIRIVIAPLTFGAGIKGKIIETIAHGVPVVTTTIGAEGIANSENIMFVCDTPSDFTGSVSKLYTNEEMWHKIRNNQIYFAKENLAMEKCKNIFSKILNI